MEKLQQFKAQILGIWGQFSSAQKATFVGVLAVAILGFGWIVSQATQTDWKVLYSDLEPTAAARITEELGKRQIPFKIVNESTISVPRERVHEARLQIAGTGVTDSTAAGYELFDESDFGMTAFTQKVNFKRAMENELARTIKHIRNVKDARVHLVMPEDSLFAENQKTTTASVVLKMDGGATLPAAQVQAIQHLVASAVEGMSPDNVTLVDQDGRLLARPETDTLLGEGAMANARALEGKIEERIVELLAPIVGASGVRAKVHVDMDTKVVVETAELFDPEQTAIRSEQRSESVTSDGKAVAGGAPGIGANLNAEVQERAPESATSSKIDQVTNYEVSKRVVQTTQNGQGIARLSVAVLVDQAALKDPAQLTELEALVKSAVGIEEARGDAFELSSAAFMAPPVVEESPMDWVDPGVMVPVARYATLGFLALLLFFFVVRPVTQSLKPAPAQLAAHKPEEVEVEIVGRRVGEVGEVPAVEGAKLGQLRQEVIGLSEGDLEKTAMILSHWIRTDNHA
ncbi:flagellar M-ring protein FliF [Microvenator marinus]|uniref:Flagellar M-ring protein n=1 Tax=Microvenator marinus TaxID=2600177 RepID=A0A5B8XYB4_9DELT|nr:flagellar basal-body MS-ring/collar protein FliF [Microvenator marinus]QED28646.1 flagellar M-ring protein FliF [Microvenator marinus]